jgi:hypothetical protein
MAAAVIFKIESQRNFKTNLLTLSNFRQSVPDYRLSDNNKPHVPTLGMRDGSCHLENKNLHITAK